MVANKYISIHRAYIFINSVDNMQKSQCIQKSEDPSMNRVDHCDYKLRYLKEKKKHLLVNKHQK